MIEFKDPENKFAIFLPEDWKYNDKIDFQKKNLHQFKVPSGAVFQISCNPINDHISKIISAKRIAPQDRELPNFSFIEDFQIEQSKEIYTWVALIDGQFFFAMFFFDPRTKDSNNLGMELYEIRLALSKLKVPFNNGAKGRCSGFIPDTEKINYKDIQNWRNPPSKYFQNFGSEKKYETIFFSTVNIDVIKLYALLTTKISHQPNGMHSLLKIGKPLDNPIWWDFILECDKGFIHVWRTPFLLEVLYHFEGNFDLEDFFIKNIELYHQEIETQMKSFDQHTVYINHYQSYSECVNTLWKKIKEIDLTIPPSPEKHLTKDSERENYVSQVEIFMENSISYHALAKSLVLNAAFKIESFINLVIRIGATRELRGYPDVLSKFLKQDFSSRVKNLGFYTQIFAKQVDMSGDIYRETKELMTLRNKYVHYEEDTIHNKLGVIAYDRDIPLHPVEKNRPAIDATIKTYHQPDMQTVQKAYETANRFVEMIESLFITEIKGNLQFLIQQNPIGYNESNGVYSAVYNPNAVDFFTGMGNDE